MKMARKMKRNLEKKARQGDALGVRDVTKAKKAVRHATTREIVIQKNVFLEAQTNIMLMIDITMMRTFSFGRDRLLRLRKKIYSNLECLKMHYVSIEELEEIIKQEGDMAFYVNPESKNWEMIRRTEYDVVRIMSAVFLVSLRDEFGFGPKRLAKAYDILTEIAGGIQERKINFDKLRQERERRGRHGKKAA